MLSPRVEREELSRQQEVRTSSRHRPKRECETFQSEKDWHISTESLFIVMKLVRVGELNA
ncbi:hypothetical protein QMP26_13385 [Enterocloster clostridioformis]